MRVSQSFIPTLKEVPADAQVISHQLMLRAGYIRKVAAGIYNYLPLALRVFRKIETIIREEMNRIDAQELLLPMVQPKELWQESGRWGQYGAELLRIKDRKDADFCLGPTHEEVITAVVRDQTKSYKQLPLRLYQIQTKFRDEVRPRFGLMRGREFIMKDAYSFDANVEGALKAYDAMQEAYNRIFRRCGLHFAMVEADTGSIGGNRSHEFQVLAETGEDSIASCEACGYAANVELAAIGACEHPSASQPSEDLRSVKTPGAGTIEAVAAFLKMPQSQCMKTLVWMADEQPVMALCQGDHQINEVKLKKALGAAEIRLMNDAEIAKYVGPVGYLGPINSKASVRVVADAALKGGKGLSAGANLVDTHFMGFAMQRDAPDATFMDIREAQAGDPCGKCGAPFALKRGIEVGHVFYLGTKYSAPMQATVLDAAGKSTAMEMGCYGIGVGRTAAAAIEQNHDDKGIIWPMPIAPYQVSLVRIGNDEASIQKADEIYTALISQGIEVLYDDRDERPGVKFADSDLIGCPVRLTVGGRSLKEGKAEYLLRSHVKNGPLLIDLEGVVQHVVKDVSSLMVHA